MQARLLALDGDHLGVEHPAVAPDPHGVADRRFDSLDLEPEPDQAADPAGAPGGTGDAGGPQRRFPHTLMTGSAGAERCGRGPGPARAPPPTRPVAHRQQGPAHAAEGGLDLGVDATRPGVDDAPAPLDRLVGHHGDPAVGHVGLELGRPR